MSRAARSPVPRASDRPLASSHDGVPDNLVAHIPELQLQRHAEPRDGGHRHLPRSERRPPCSPAPMERSACNANSPGTWSWKPSTSANRGVVVEHGRRRNPRPSTLVRYPIWPVTASTVGNAADSALLTKQMGTVERLDLSDTASRGVVLLHSNFPSNQTVRQSILPFPQYSNAITPSQAPMGKTWYDSCRSTPPNACGNRH